jgi:hypothetical protein
MDMRTSIRIVIAAAALVVWAGSASADVDAYATIYKDKDVTFQVYIQITKDITVDVNYDADLAGAAEADLIVNQKNERNRVGAAGEYLTAPVPSGPTGTKPRLSDVSLDPYLISLTATIDRSINDNTGIIGVNQDVGANVNQGNVVAFAQSDATDVFADSQAQVDQSNRLNVAWQVECFIGSCPGDTTGPSGPDSPRLTRSALISESITGNAGAVQVNQNAGSNNNQANALALTVGLNSHVALAEADLGQVNDQNQIFAVNTFKTDTIQSSIVDNSGIVGVNQTVGNNNNQAANVSFSALVWTGNPEVPGISLD